MRLRAGSLRWWQASLLTLAVAAAATVQASATAWAQTPVDPPEQEQPAAPPGGGVPTDLDAPRDPAPEGDDSGSGEGGPVDLGEPGLSDGLDGFDVTDGLDDLTPEEIEGHELGSEPVDEGLGDLLDTDGFFEWETGEDTRSLRLLDSQAAATYGGGANASSLSELAAVAAVSYAPLFDGSSNETSTLQRPQRQQQADNWFVSDTGQLFLPVGGVLVSFAQGARADWARYGVAPERVTALEGLSNAFRIATSSDAESLRLVKQLAGMPGVESVTPDMFTPDSTGDTELGTDSPKSYPLINSIAHGSCNSNKPPMSDALSACLWHLDRSVRSGTAVDINIGNVWDTNKGDGITVSVVDKTWEAGHEDLVGNANRAVSTYWGGHTGENGQINPYHGTAVAGIIGARDNTVGGRGVAPRVGLLNVNYLDHQSTYTQTRAFLHRKDTVAVANHSYGPAGTGRLYRESPIVVAALEESLESGFGGKGIVHVKTAGNGKDDRLGDEAALDEGNNHRGVIVACAVNSGGTDAAYSEEGAMLWVCGPSGDLSYLGMLAPIGKNHYHPWLRGTSYSAPVVSGVAALVRSANSALTWRDVKLILANTAQKNDSDDSSWQAGALKYGSKTDSYSYSRKYGFGLVNASAAVAAANNWTALPPMFASSDSSSGPWNVTDSGSAKEFSIDLASDISFIEHVDVNVNMSTSNFRAMKMTLVSPSGRESLLVDSSPILRVRSAEVCLCALYGGFKLASTRHLGESAAGTWKLKVENTTGVAATLNSWEITVHGHNPSKTEVIELSAPSAVAEGDDFTVTVTHKGTLLTSDLVVPITLVPNGATPPGQTGADYTALTSITIPAGSATASATVYTTEDKVHEIAESINVRVGSLPSPYTPNSIPRHVIILDDDQPQVSITSVEGSVNEAQPAAVTWNFRGKPLLVSAGSIHEGQSASFNVTMDRDPARTIVVVGEVQESHKPRAYLSRETVRFYAVFASAGTKTIHVETLMDRVDDPRRLISAQIRSSSSADYRIKGSGSAYVWVSDDLPRVSVVSDGDIDEGGSASFTLEAVPAPVSPVVVPVSVAESGFFGVDTSGRSVTIGSSGAAKLVVPTVRHGFAQPDGAVAVTVGSPDDDSFYPNPQSSGRAASVKVTDLDKASFEVDAAVLAKAKRQSTSPAYFFKPATINLWKRVLLAFGESPSGVTGGPMTAAEAKTYADQGLHADWSVVAAELLRLETARSMTPVVIVTGGGDITEGEDAVFTLRALPGPASDIDARVTVTAAGSFGAATGARTVTIPADGTATLTVSTSHDGTDGADGAVTVTVVDAAAYDVYARPAASVAVADSDNTPAQTVVSIAGGPAVAEGEAATFTITADPAPAAAVDVAVTITAAGSYGVSTGARTVSVPTSGSVTLTVATTNDDLDALDGSVTATLVNGTGYGLDSNASSATVAVTDNDTPEISITATGGDITEGETAVFTVTADPAPAAALAVSFTVNQLGDFGIDGRTRTLTIPTTGSATLNVNTQNDNTDEPDGRIEATLLAGTGYILDSNARSARVSVADDDVPVVSITAGGDVTEGGSAVFTLTAVPAPAAQFDITVTVAVAGSYGVTAGSRTVTIPTSGTATLTLATTNDNTDEANGSVTATLVDGAAYDLDTTTTATINIADNDNPTPATPVVSITAGGDVTEGGSAVFTLTAVPAPAAQFDITVTVAVAGSYGVTAGSRTVTIPTSGTATLTLATTDDNTDEANGSVTATLVDGAAYDLGSTVTATVAVADDDGTTPTVSAQLISDVRGYAAETENGDDHVNRWKRVLLAFGESVPGFTGTAMTAAEAQTFADKGWSRWDPVVTALRSVEAGTATPPATPVVSIAAGGDVTEGGSAVFTLTAVPAPAAQLDVTVTIATTGDYGVTAGSRTVTIPTSGTATLTLATTDDSTDELNGSVTATLVDGAAYDIASTATATVNIADNDDPAPATPVVSIAAGGDVTEGGSAVFTLTAVPAPATQFDVTVTVAATGDYGVTTGSRTVTIPTGGTATLTLATSNDSVDEANGSVTATLVDGAAYDLDTTTTATINIADNETPAVSVTSAGDVTEGGNAVFTLVADPAPHASLDVAVTVTTTGDFGVTAGSRTVTIPTSGTATLTLATTDDSTDEANGTITAMLVDGTAYDLDSASSATVAVADDDAPAGSCTVTAPSDDLIQRVRGYHDLNRPKPGYNQNWLRVLIAFGAETSGTLEPFTAAEARNGEQVWDGWTPIRQELERLEQETAQCATPVVSITAGGDVTEGGSAVFTLTAAPAPATQLDVTVTVATTGDYGVTTGSRTVTIPTSGTATLTLATIDDNSDEANGTITATLVDGAAYDVASTATATVNIADDDNPPPVVSAQLISDVRGYAAETQNGDDHVNRWKRVLLAFGETVPGFTGTAMTAAEAQTFAAKGWTRWDPIVTALQTIEAGTTTPPPTPVVSIAAAGDITEGGNAVFTLTATPAPSAQFDVTVTVTTTGSYGITTGTRTVTIPTSGTATLTLATTNDNTDEPNGSVTATLVDGAAYDLDTTTTATINIADNDNPTPATPVVSIAAGGNITEGGNAVFTLTATPAPAAQFNVTVTVTTTGSYGITTGTRTVTIPTSGTATLTLATTDDNTDEANGTITATLVDGAAYDLDTTTTATINIADNDNPTPATPVVSIAAGGNITEGGNAVFTLVAAPAPAAQFDVTVTVTTSGSYGVTAGTRTVTIPTSGTATLTLATTDNNTDEANGTITATLVDGAAYDLDTTATATINIADNDNPTPATPVVSIAAGGNITEGGNAVFTLVAAPAPAAQFDVTVTVTTSGSYGVTAGTRTVTIPTSGTATLTLATTDNNTDEANGTITATLVDGAAYDLSSTATATVNIADNETPAVSITSAGDVTEGGNAVFTLVAAPAPHASLDVTVTITTSGSYGVTAGIRTVTIPTSGTATLTLATTDDNTDEANGTITATLVDGAAYDLGSASSATVAVSDNDDTTTVLISVNDGSGDEGDQADFTVTLSQAAPHRITVRWAAHYGGAGRTALTGEFWRMSGTMVFQPGETTKRGFTFLDDDNQQEGDEVFLIKLSQPTGATIERGTATMTIIDND